MHLNREVHGVERLCVDASFPTKHQQSTIDSFFLFLRDKLQRNLQTPGTAVMNWVWKLSCFHPELSQERESVPQWNNVTLCTLCTYVNCTLKSNLLTFILGISLLTAGGRSMSNPRKHFFFAFIFFLTGIPENYLADNFKTIWFHYHVDDEQFRMNVTALSSLLQCWCSLLKLASSWITSPLPLFLFPVLPWTSGGFYDCKLSRKPSDLDLSTMA